MIQITHQELQDMNYNDEDFDLKCLIMVKISDESNKEYEMFINDQSRKKTKQSYVGKLVVFNDNFEINYINMFYQLDWISYSTYKEFYLEDNMYRAIRYLKFMSTLS